MSPSSEFDIFRTCILTLNQLIKSIFWLSTSKHRRLAMSIDASLVSLELPAAAPSSPALNLQAPTRVQLAPHAGQAVVKLHDSLAEHYAFMSHADNEGDNRKRSPQQNEGKALLTASDTVESARSVWLLLHRAKHWPQVDLAPVAEQKDGVEVPAGPDADDGPPIMYMNVNDIQAITTWARTRAGQRFIASKRSLGESCALGPRTWLRCSSIVSGS